MTLSEALQGVSVVKMFQTMYGKMVVTHDVKISGVQYDSRRVQRENLFVALRGSGSDGHDYLQAAIAAGAKVLVMEDDAAVPDPLCMHHGVVKVVVSDSRRALARIAANYHGRPADSLTVIGVTGTNGKTTTTYLLKQMLEAAPGVRAGLIGTVEVVIGDERRPATHTTPESLELHGLFAEMKRKGCTHVVMEVSSHALHQRRVYGVPFAAAVFTNLTQDHLDYHRTMEEYFEAKRSLFTSLAPSAVAVTNADSPDGLRITDGCAAPVRTYGVDSAADVKAENVSITVSGSSLRIGGTDIRTPLVGRFNIYNFLGAYTAVTALGIPVSTGTCARLEPAPGRFQQFHAPAGWTAIVDYAHTPDALENCLQTVHDVLPAQRTNRIITVFGAGGDRDRTKRPVMGRIAAAMSDIVVVTSDNPRTEDPAAIIGDILGGIADRTAVTAEPDRATAIRTALAQARSGDVVLIAGKGHEDYQVLGTQKVHFSDREQVMTYISAQA